MDERRFAEDALGATSLSIGGKNLPPPEDLEFEIEEPQVICRLHCRGCGFICHLSASDIKLLGLTEPPGGWPTHYVSVSACELCSDHHTNPEVREIPRP